MSDDWKAYADARPNIGHKIVVVCDDGCSSSLALMTDDGPIDGECGEPLSENFMDGAIWIPLPDSYPLGFMEVTEDDWY